MRLQDVYNLDVKDLAQGKVQGLEDVPEQRLSGKSYIYNCTFIVAVVAIAGAVVIVG